MDNFFKHLIDAATEIAPLVIPGAGPVIKVAKAIVDALESGKDMLDPEEAAVIDETVLDDLRARVNAHFDETIAGLRGEQE